MPAPDSRLPIHLEGYDPFAALVAWRKSGDPSQRRDWRIIPCIGAHVGCRLTWVQQGQILNIQQAALSHQEAVFRAIEEFKRWEGRNAANH